MPQFEDDAIALRYYNLAEADRIVVFLTRSHGLLRAVAKGAKRLTSKFGSGLEPFTHLNLHWFQKEHQELASIREVESISSSFKLLENEESLNILLGCAALLEHFAVPGETDEKLFRLTKATVEAVRNHGGLQEISLYFEVWLMKLSGFLPDWNQCTECAKKYDLTNTFKIDANLRFYCSDCGIRYNRNLLSESAFITAKTILSSKPDEFFAQQISAETVNELLSQIRRLQNDVVGREIKRVPAFGNSVTSIK